MITPRASGRCSSAGCVRESHSLAAMPHADRTIGQWPRVDHTECKRTRARETRADIEHRVRPGSVVQKGHRGASEMRQPPAVGAGHR